MRISDWSSDVCSSDLGNLFCFNVADGKVLWSKDLKEAYKTRAALWGYASHPLIEGDKLICVVGTDVAHAAAFDKQTGEEIWRRSEERRVGKECVSTCRSRWWPYH